MRFPPHPGGPLKNMLLGIEVTLFGVVVISQSYFFEYSALVGDVIVLVGLWITVSGYYSDAEPDA